jgi:hypothetical protein
MASPRSNPTGTDLGSHSGDPIVLNNNNDLYGYYSSATTLASTVLKSETPLVVGVYGRWGRGKTTFIDTLRERISASSSKTLHIQYSPWNFQLNSFEDVWIALITEFSSQNKKGFSESLLKRVQDINYWKASKTVLGAGATLVPIFGEGFKKLVEGLPEGTTKNEFDQFIETKKVFDETVDKYLKEHEGGRIFVYIDDIDRCEPTVSVYVLRAIQVLCRKRGCVFVLGLDRDVIVANLAQAYNNRSNFAREYLDKIVQLHVELPRIEFADLKNAICFRANGDERSGISTFAPWIASAMDYNPRKVERFVFLFDYKAQLRKQIHQSKEDLFQLLKQTVLFTALDLKWPHVSSEIIKNTQNIGCTS